MTAAHESSESLERRSHSAQSTGEAASSDGPETHFWGAALVACVDADESDCDAPRQLVLVAAGDVAVCRVLSPTKRSQRFGRVTEKGLVRRYL